MNQVSTQGNRTNKMQLKRNLSELKWKKTAKKE